MVLVLDYFFRCMNLGICGIFVLLEGVFIFGVRVEWLGVIEKLYLVVLNYFLYDI